MAQGVSHAIVLPAVTGHMIIPTVPGACLDAVYLQGSAESPAGGWCELLPLRDGRVTLSIGDVAGRGLPAAFTMGQVRRSLRLASLLDPEPSAVLRFAHDRLMEAVDAEVEVTAFFGVFDPSASALTYASAAHPFAVCCLPDGTMDPLPAEGAPLGGRQQEARPARVAALPAGAMVVLYTSGLAGASAIMREESPLARAVRAAHAQPAAERAHRIADALLEGRTLTRDVALITLTIAKP